MASASASQSRQCLYLLMEKGISHTLRLWLGEPETVAVVLIVDLI